MTKILLLFFMNYFIISKISHARHINQDWPKAPAIPTAKAPTPAPAAPTPAPAAPTPAPAAPTPAPAAPTPAPAAPTPAPAAPTPAPAAPTPVSTNAPIFDRITPKCYPETATAYFLPAPPSSPKITVLNPNVKDVPPNLNQNVREKPDLFKEVLASLSFPPPSEVSNRVNFPPPPPCLTGLPDLMDEIPSKTQERISRLAGSENKAPVCESCAALIKKLPIFNFDQELLDGFLAGIGI